MLTITIISVSYSTCVSYPDKDLEVHKSEPEERQHPSGESGVEDEGEGVPEYVERVTTGFTRVNIMGSIVLRYCPLDELWDIEDDGHDRDWDEIDHHPHGA